MAEPAAPDDKIVSVHANDTTPAEPQETLGSLVRKLGALGPLAIASATLPVLGGFALLYFGHTVAEWLRSHGDIGPFVYVAGFTLLAGLALLPTYAQSLLGGYAFGAFTGSMAALSGFVLAAGLGYGVSRAAAGDRVTHLFHEHPRWEAVYHELLGRGFWRTLGMVTLLRLPPNSPFAMTNLVLAAARVPWLTYALGTAVGMAPRTVAAVYIGSQFSSFSGGESAPWSLKIVGIVLSIAVLAIIGWIANHALQRIAGPQRGAESSPSAAG